MFPVNLPAVQVTTPFYLSLSRSHPPFLMHNGLSIYENGFNKKLFRMYSNVLLSQLILT